MRPIQPSSFVVCKNSIAWQFNPQKVFRISGIYERIKNPSWRDFPVAVEIHPTSTCILNCRHCSYGQRNKNGSELKPEEVLDIIKWGNSIGIHSIVFSGGGEPLSWPYWSNILDELTSLPKIPLFSMATNSVLIGRSLSPRHYDRFSIFQISFYGHDVASFTKYARQNAFGDFIRSMHVLFSNKPIQLQCTAKITLSSSNIDIWEKNVTFALQWPFDALVIKIIGNFEGSHGIEVSDKRIHRLAQEIKDFNWPSHLSEIFSSLETDASLSEFNIYDTCKVVQMGLYMLIRADGIVYPCIASADDPAACFGSIRETDLYEIWLGEAHGKVVTMLNDKYKAGNCRFEVCRHIAYNEIINRNFSIHHLNEKLIPML